MTAPLLDISGLTLSFPGRLGRAHVLNGVELTIERGEAVAVVGESGSGKSMTAHAVMGLLNVNPGIELRGSIRFDGQELVGRPDKQMRKLRGSRIGMIFQDPMSSLNPVMSIGGQLTEHLRYHTDLSRAARWQRGIELLDRVGIADPAGRMNSYPHQFSGGMCQRVMIAMAIACGPALLIADEPTTALDVSVQAEIISLVAQLRVQYGTSVLWITHDLASVAGLADRVAIMYSGRIVETAAIDTVFDQAAHPYARALLSAVPTLETKRGVPLFSIEGYPPDPSARPPGCSFAPRCPMAIGRCTVEEPRFEAVAPGHHAACFRARESLAAKASAAITW